MYQHLKRRRGRPLGSGIDDSVYLNQIADLKFENPKLSTSSAAKRVRKRAGSTLQHVTEPTFVRRMQRKWNESESQLLVAAEKRRAEALNAESRIDATLNMSSLVGWLPEGLPAATIARCVQMALSIAERNAINEAIGLDAQTMKTMSAMTPYSAYSLNHRCSPLHPPDSSVLEEAIRLHESGFQDEASELAELYRDSLLRGWR